MQHRSVDHPARHRLEQLGMWKTVEIATEVRLHHFSLTAVNQLVDLTHRVQGAAVPPIGILLRLQVRLEDGLEHEDCCRGCHPVPDGGYP